MIRVVFSVVVAVWLTLAAWPGGYRQDAGLKIPASLVADHQGLHEALVAATKTEGKVGEAAKAVAEVLHEHFVREEEIAMPPLGLLVSLSQGTVTPEMKDALKMTDALKAELPRMLKEHVAIKAAVKDLAAAAKEAGDGKAAECARRLAIHAQTEEEVLYPAAILIGEYLKLKLK
jgi:hypothetical protein